MINYKKPIVVVAGPTASGKSTLALKLAKDINGYIINADSRQVYKELQIGTAQPTPDRIDGNVWYIDNIKHYLYGHISAQERYNLFQYQKDVQAVLDKEGGIPILVGGTGLYIDCIVHNYDLKERVKGESKYSREELEKMSVKELHSLLSKEVLNNLNDSDIKNPVRLIRAIERGGVNKETGRHLNHIYMIVDVSTEALRSRISHRVEQMLGDGLIEENRELIESGFKYSMYSMQSIGYQEFDGYFQEKKSLEQVKDEIILHTVQYSKRQQTWFKKNKGSIKVKDYNEAYEATLKFLSIS